MVLLVSSVKTTTALLCVVAWLANAASASQPHHHLAERALIHRRAVDEAVELANSPKHFDNDEAETSPVRAKRATTASGKRGLAFNDGSLTLPFTGSAEVTWTYNWWSAMSPSNHLSSAEYVPMLWSNASDLTSVWSSNVAAMRTQGSKHLLGFNEPDLCIAGAGSSCMDLSYAVSTWKTYMQPYAGSMLLGAPAVTNGGSPLGLTWLSKFMSACTDCTFDFIPVHWYSNKNAGLTYLKSHIEAVRKVANGKPIWITEFGLTDDYTSAELISFLTEAMAWLDAQSDIARYAYFWDAPGTNWLIDTDGKSLSAAGKLYFGANAPSDEDDGTCSDTASTSTHTSTLSSTTSAVRTTASSSSTSSQPTSHTSVTSSSSSSARTTTTTKTTTTTTVSHTSSSVSSSSVSGTKISTQMPATTSTVTKTTSTTSAKATSTGALQILSAFYATTDVTSGARSAFLKNNGASLAFSPSNLQSRLGLTSDPWSGKNKTLHILYTYKGAKRTVSFTASSASCTITSTECGSSAVTTPSGTNKPSASKATLVAVMWGGRQMTGPTLWNKLYAQAVSSAWFSFSQTFVGSINPMPNQSKSATVWYTDRSGKLLALVAKQNDWAQFPILA